MTLNQQPNTKSNTNAITNSNTNINTKSSVLSWPVLLNIQFYCLNKGSLALYFIGFR